MKRRRRHEEEGEEEEEEEERRRTSNRNFAGRFRCRVIERLRLSLSLLSRLSPDETPETLLAESPHTSPELKMSI